MKKIISKTFLMLLLIAASYAATFALNIVLARLLPPVYYGDFSVIYKLAFLFAPIFLLGANFAVLKFLPEYISEESWGAAKGYLQFNRNRMIFVCLVGLIVLALVFGIDYHDLHQYDFFDSLHVGFYILPLFALTTYFSEYLRSIGKIFLSSILFDLLMPLLFFCVLIILPIKPWELWQVLLCYGSTLVIIALLQISFIKKHLPAPIKQAEAVDKKIEWKPTSRQLMFSRVTLNLLFSAEIILLKIFGSHPADVGIFGVLLTVGSLYWLIYTAALYVVSPIISPIAAKKDTQQLQSLFNTTVSIIGSLIILLTIVIIIFRTPILAYFGNQYIIGGPALIIIAIGYAITATFGIIWFFIGLSGHEKSLILPTIVVTAYSLIVTSLLIHYFELMGAAIGLASTDILIAIWLMILLKIKLGIKPFFIY